MKMKIKFVYALIQEAFVSLIVTVLPQYSFQNGTCPIRAYKTVILHLHVVAKHGFLARKGPK